MCKHCGICSNNTGESSQLQVWVAVRGQACGNRTSDFSSFHDKAAAWHIGVLTNTHTLWRLNLKSSAWTGYPCPDGKIHIQSWSPMSFNICVIINHACSFKSFFRQKVASGTNSSCQHDQNNPFCWGTCAGSRNQSIALTKTSDIIKLNVEGVVCWWIGTDSELVNKGCAAIKNYATASWEKR